MGEERFIASSELAEWLKAQGLPLGECRRVIIDIQIGQPVVVYIEKYGTESMLQFIPSDVKEAEIVVVGGD